MTALETRPVPPAPSKQPPQGQILIVDDDPEIREVLRIAYEEFNTSFGSGLGPLAGKVFRIGHLGDLNEGMCLTALSVAEMALYRAGVTLRLGSGVGAAQAWYAQVGAEQSTVRVAAE